MRENIAAFACSIALTICVMAFLMYTPCVCSMMFKLRFYEQMRTPDREEAAIKALSSKKSDWYYEREWRFLTKHKAIDVPGRLQILGQNPVKGIYFGPRTEGNVIDAVREGLREVRNGSIKFYNPTSINRRYQYEWNEIR